MLHALKWKQTTDESLNDECLCKCYMHHNRNKRKELEWMFIWMLHALKSKQNKRDWMRVYVNVMCTEIETKEKGLNECLSKCYMRWNQTKQKRKELEWMFM
jgi:hypothetical protein